MNSSTFLRKNCDQINFCEMKPERLPAISGINERFSEQFKISLSNALGAVADIRTTGRCSVEFGTYIEKLPQPTFFSLMDFQKTGGSALVTLESDLFFSMLDVAFGGVPRSSTHTLKKEVTKTDIDLAKEIFRRVIETYADAWKPLAELGAVQQRMETNPLFVPIVPPGEKVLVSEFEIELKGVKGKMALAVPYMTLFPARDRLIEA